jgi:hypothetical protein
MPVILDNGSEGLRTWLDPKRYEWSKELQNLLRPFEGELEIYPVNKDVGKVGNNSPSFIIPIDSKENKSNIANFFAKDSSKPPVKEVKLEDLASNITEERQPDIKIKKEAGFVEEEQPGGAETGKIKEEPSSDTKGIKREADESPLKDDEPPTKKVAAHSSPSKSTSTASQRGRINKTSATSNGTKSPSKPKAPGTQKITKFFGNSA